MNEELESHIKEEFIINDTARQFVKLLTSIYHTTGYSHEYFKRQLDHAINFYKCVWEEDEVD